VIAYQGNSRELVEQLRSLDINVLAFAEAENLFEIGMQAELIKLIAGPLDSSPDLGHLAFVRRLAAMVCAATSGFTVFYGYPGELMYSCAPGSFIDSLIQLAGGENIVTDDSVRWPQVSAEFVVAANPDYILTGTSCTEDQDPAVLRAALIDQLRADEFWSQLDAVQAGRVIVIDSDILTRPGPRILDALEQFIAQLEPEHRPSTQEVTE